jgi:SAM-dependent methyltransferase
MAEFTSDLLKTAWSNEYKRKGIPSSFRKEPTQPLVEFISWCRKKGINSGAAGDLGCGQGRNSFYLAQEGFKVTALDLLQENADRVNFESNNRNLAISAYAQDLSEKWPVSEHTLDIAIDIFCYKHIVEKEKQKRYRAELWRALKHNGYFFISLASVEDGFYGPLLAHSPDINRRLIIDPYSSIPSLLYTLDELVLEFSDLFHVVEAEEKQSTSPMYGKEYSRWVLNCVFQKNK